jgi:hypothetical protein
MMLNHPQYAVDQKENILDFYNNLVNSPEGRYYVALSVDNLGPVMFVGKLIADIGSLKISHHQFVKITAHCGIKQLETIEFRPDGFDALDANITSKKYSFIELITDIMQRNDVAKEFYEVPPLPLTAMYTVGLGWTESNIPTSVWNTLHMHNHYYEEKSVTYRRYESAMTVLVDILNGFNMRLYYSNGSWHLEQLGIQDRLSPGRSTHGWNGSQLQFISSKVQRDVDNNVIKVLPTPELTHIAPLKAVALKQNKQYYNILAGTDIFYRFDANDNRGPHNLGYQIGTGNQMIMDLRFDVIIDPTLWQIDVSTLFEFEIKLGDYYLVNDPWNDSNNNGIQDAGDDLQLNNNDYILTPIVGFGYDVKRVLWTQTPSTVKLIKKEGWSNHSANNFESYVITLLSNEIIEDGEFIITLVDWKVLNSNTLEEIPTFNSNLIQWKLFKKTSRILIVSNGIDGLTEVADNTIIYEIGNTKNSLVYETSLRFFDSDRHTTRQLYRKLTVNSINFYIPTTEWTDSDLGQTLPIQQLVLAQMLSMRSKYGRVVRSQLINTAGTTLYQLDRYNWGNKLHIPLTWSHNLDQGVYSLDLWEVYKDFPGVNIIEIDPGTDPQPPNYPIHVGDPASPPRLGIEYWEEWIDVNATYVVLTGYCSNLINTTDLYAVKSKWAVYVNGVKQLYVLPTESVINRTWSFDDANPDRIRIFKPSGIIKHIEVIKYY